MDDISLNAKCGIAAYVPRFLNSRLKKSYPKTRKIEPSDGFLLLMETSLDTRWEVEHSRLFFVNWLLA